MIEKINFGRFAAEADVINSDEEVFVTTRQGRAFTLPDHKILIGRKGSGKSALEMCFGKHYKNNYDYLLSINAEAIRFRKLIDCYRELEDSAGNIMELRKGLANIWEYSILVSCMLDVGKDKTLAKGPQAIIHNFLRKEGLLKKRIYDLLIDTLENVFKLVLGSRGKATSDIIRAIDNFPLDKVNFEDAKNALYEILKDTKGFLVTFDHIDRYFEVEARPYSHEHDQVEKYALRNFLTGLVQAIYNISIAKLGNVIQFKVFLPKDKFESIRFRDLDKIKEFVFEIKWTLQELEEFISRRIAHSLNLRNKQNQLIFDTQSTWYKVFPRTVTNRSVSNVQEPIESYLIRHTHYKPRDLQFYCNRIKNLYLLEGDSKNPVISEDIIRRAMHQATRELVDNFFIEFAYEYPFLKRLLEQFRKSPNVMSYVDDFFPKVKRFHSRSTSHYSPDELVDLLYKVGFVGGIVHNANSDRASEFIITRKFKGTYYSNYFYYIDPTFNLRDSDFVAIHPVFNEYLHLDINDGYII